MCKTPETFMSQLFQPNAIDFIDYIKEKMPFIIKMVMTDEGEF